MSYINMVNKREKKGQEEMVGFALIIVVVAVILLFFLSFSLRNPQKESIESYEADSFLQSALLYTTECEANLESHSVQSLIHRCASEEVCYVGEEETNSCDYLKEVLEGMTAQSWKVGADRPIKGYELQVMVADEELIIINGGNPTQSYKGAQQDLSGDVKVTFKAYYE